MITKCARIVQEENQQDEKQTPKQQDPRDEEPRAVGKSLNKAVL